MIPNRPFRKTAESARERLLEAAVALVRTQGFTGTSVDDLCAKAGVTKGAFFHHFPSKQQLGVELAHYWSTSTAGFFAEAPFRHHKRAIDRVLGYIDLRTVLIDGAVETFCCVAGTMVQDTFRSLPIREACRESIMGNAAALEDDLAQALADAGLPRSQAPSLARHVQTVIQGAFVLAKTQEGDRAAEIARESLGHLRAYFAMLLKPEAAKDPA